MFLYNFFQKDPEEIHDQNIGISENTFSIIKEAVKQLCMTILVNGTLFQMIWILMVCNNIDNCPQVYNPNQEDNDNDNTEMCDGIGILEIPSKQKLNTVDILEGKQKPMAFI